MRKSIIRIICFILILCAVLIRINNIFKLKYCDGIYDVTKFYELEENTVDVLFLGSSHAFEDFNTGTLWNEYGIASYILGGSTQPMWNTYYYLKEALKTQRPELIVLEGYTMAVYQDDEYASDSTTIKNIYGLRWTPNKIYSIITSSPKERWSEYILEYGQYHTRYTELCDADFLPNQNDRLYDDWKGFCCNMGTFPIESIDVTSITERLPLHEKTEMYYRKILELAQEKDIPIVVVISPYAKITENDQMHFNTASDIAAEYNIPFVNFNYYINEMNLDYSTDSSDNEHLNYHGNQKYSSYLGEYLKENFDIPDRRGDENYDSWQKQADYITQIIYNQQQLRENCYINALPAALSNSNYWVMISVDGTCNTSDEYVSTFLQQLGIYEENSNGIWLRQNNLIIWSSGTGNTEQYIRTAAHDFCLRRSINSSGQYTNEIIIDNTNYLKVSNGVNVVVYDTITENVVDAFGFNKDDNFNMVR